jgi:hypothetical protein
MKASKNILALTVLAIFAMATPALASYGGGSNAMPQLSHSVVCPTTTPGQFKTNAIYGGSNVLLGVVIGTTHPATQMANSAQTARLNSVASGDSGSNALGTTGSPMICSTLQPNHMLD